MLVGGCFVVSLSLRVAVVGLAACGLPRRPRLSSCRLASKFDLLLQIYRLQIVFSFEFGSADAPRVSFACLAKTNFFVAKGWLESLHPLAGKK